MNKSFDYDTPDIEDFYDSIIMTDEPIEIDYDYIQDVLALVEELTADLKSNS